MKCECEGGASLARKRGQVRIKCEVRCTACPAGYRGMRPSATCAQKEESIYNHFDDVR